MTDDEETGSPDETGAKIAEGKYAMVPRLSHNLISSFLTQVYVTAIGIAVVPLYLRYMSPEAYGLVGFFVVLQTWFNLLDMGLSPTVARETARFRGGSLSALAYRQVVRGLQLLFLAAGLVGTLALCALSGVIAAKWLGSYSLDPAEVHRAILLMAVGVGVRWLSGLYRAMVTGQERLVWLSGFSAFIATLRFPGAIPVLALVSAEPSVFFAYQLLVAAIELLGLVIRAHSIMPKIPAAARIGWSMAPVAAPLRFSGVVALTALLGAMITQTDKLVLSSVLPLQDYGYFTLAIVAANGVLLFSAPAAAALMPRLSLLEAQGDNAALLSTYRAATQILSVVAAAVSATACFGSLPILSLWLGNADIARHAAPIFALYAVGNGLFTVAALPYYLQYAKGSLRLHLIGNIGFALLFVPLIIVVARSHGAVGAGVVWVLVNALSLFAWLPLVHARFAPGLNAVWYTRDVLPIIIGTYAAAWLASIALPFGGSAPVQLLSIGGLAAISMCVAVATSSMARQKLGVIFKRQ